MRSPRARAAAMIIAAAPVLVVGAACGTGTSGAGGAGGAGGDEGLAADRTVCAADATALEQPYGDVFPTTWPFPPDTVVYDTEDRGDDGTIVTGVSRAPFTTVVDFMNNEVVDAGFSIESGETEDRDAEAEWEGNGFRGRWVIRLSSQCPGETVVQVVAVAD